VSKSLATADIDLAPVTIWRASIPTGTGATCARARVRPCIDVL